MGGVVKVADGVEGEEQEQESGPLIFCKLALPVPFVMTGKLQSELCTGQLSIFN
jgi:hypothetical protein